MSALVDYEASSSSDDEGNPKVPAAAEPLPPMLTLAVVSAPPVAPTV